mmetsp:Transcript_14752/g.36102  ORF Transcript_14752/g.36102 Transcript_14752/m.36102 type:complete len:230 (-) Transcript_14752:239-928(-)
MVPRICSNGGGGSGDGSELGGDGNVGGVGGDERRRRARLRHHRRIPRRVGLVHEELQAVEHKRASVRRVEHKRHRVHCRRDMLLVHGQAHDSHAQDHLAVLRCASGDAVEEDRDLRRAVLGGGALECLLDVHQGKIAHHGRPLQVNVQRGEVRQGQLHTGLRLQALVDVRQDAHYLLLGAGVARCHLVDDARHEHVQHALELAVVGETQRRQRLIQRRQLLSLRRHPKP